MRKDQRPPDRESSAQGAPAVSVRATFPDGSAFALSPAIYARAAGGSYEVLGRRVESSAEPWSGAIHLRLDAASRTDPVTAPPPGWCTQHRTDLIARSDDLASI
ncbi:hypothetical protein R1CP_35985 (plasmid) [Rhodococcus opacus]|uniref:Uncharacterized protein n=1 Tax=Rhodococcus opacus TaxID=37919 RepID=A0A1B1KGP8_RHOOP|nr:hypothetical protein R1CP_35985 [Rhodococcus opacus]